MSSEGGSQMQWMLQPSTIWWKGRLVKSALGSSSTLFTGSVTIQLLHLPQSTNNHEKWIFFMIQGMEAARTVHPKTFIKQTKPWNLFSNDSPQTVWYFYLVKWNSQIRACKRESFKYNLIFWDSGERWAQRQQGESIKCDQDVTRVCP